MPARALVEAGVAFAERVDADPRAAGRGRPDLDQPAPDRQGRRGRGPAGQAADDPAARAARRPDDACAPAADRGDVRQRAAGRHRRRGRRRGARARGLGGRDHVPGRRATSTTATLAASPSPRPRSGSPACCGSAPATTSPRRSCGRAPRRWPRSAPGASPSTGAARRSSSARPPLAAAFELVRERRKQFKEQQAQAEAANELLEVAVPPLRGADRPDVHADRGDGRRSRSRWRGASSTPRTSRSTTGRTGTSSSSSRPPRSATRSTT